MKTIQGTVVVDAEHRGTIQFPASVEPGEYQLTIVLNEVPEPWNGFPSLDIPWIWPDGYTFRREDMYGDDGR